jgi:hypothetical protein
MTRETLGYEYTGVEDTSRMFSEKFMMMLSLRGSRESSRICPHSHHALCRSTLQHVRQMRLVVVARAPKY